MKRVAVIDQRDVPVKEFIEYAEEHRASRERLDAFAAMDGMEDIAGAKQAVDDTVPSTVGSELTVIHEGRRNNALNRHLFMLRLSGASNERVADEADRFNREQCEPPLTDSEVARVVVSVCKVGAGLTEDDVIEWMNQQFAFCVIGGRTRIIWIKSAREWELISLEAFNNLLANHVVFPDARKGRPRSAARLWLTHPQRRTYPGGVVFEPGRRRTLGAFNTFRGWAVERRSDGDCSLLIEHIRQVCAAGNVEHAHWILAWLADIVQRPDEKKGTALVLLGPQGSGKTVVGAVMGRLLGDHYVLASVEAHVTGNFNALHADLLMLHSDEATFAGDHAAAGKLKDFVTSTEQIVERKGIDASVRPNHARLLVTSEQDWVIPAALLERRFATFRLSETRMQDITFFGALHDQLENQHGYGAFLDFLLKYEYEPSSLRRIPNTAALEEQKRWSLKPEDAWMLDILTRGQLPGDENAEGKCRADDLYDDYLKRSGSRGVRRKAIETMLGSYLQERFRGQVLRRQEQQEDQTRPVFRVFPSLDEARRLFSAGMRGVTEWGEPSEWQNDDTGFRKVNMSDPFA